ncbi:hypothetical protein DMP23_42830 [Amycolatopsis sp. A1MSW2902]|uniref:hypothetical protein n=1 Tax=Amycolatopsis sp. A1MSW2902 TaxID=687413 RepID=UPI00307F10DF
MTFAVGVLDLFSLAIPGGLHLALLIYVLTRLDLFSLAGLQSVPSALLVVGAVVGSYVLGHLTAPLSVLIDRIAPRRHWAPDDARRAFLDRVPQAKERAFVCADHKLLMAAAELHDKTASGEITRLEAMSLMLRNIAFALALAAVVTLVELAVGPHRLAAGCAAARLVAALLGIVREGRRARHWCRLKTTELCFWIPDIDAKLEPAAAENE